MWKACVVPSSHPAPPPRHTLLAVVRTKPPLHTHITCSVNNPPLPPSPPRITCSVNKGSHDGGVMTAGGCAPHTSGGPPPTPPHVHTSPAVSTNAPMTAACRSVAVLPTLEEVLRAWLLPPDGAEAIKKEVVVEPGGGDTPAGAATDCCGGSLLAPTCFFSASGIVGSLRLLLLWLLRRRRRRRRIKRFKSDPNLSDPPTPQSNRIWIWWICWICWIYQIPLNTRTSIGTAPPPSPPYRPPPPRDRSQAQERTLPDHPHSSPRT